MSQYGQKSGAWGRPAGAAAPGQIPGFGGMFPMVGMPMGGMGMVNQAAFSQPGIMGMGVMGAVQQQQARNSAAASTIAAAAAVPAAGKNQRTFVGVVTKMHDNYGFVDDDVFFQHSVIRGAHPRVGDKVMVEANYNPQMPFKWNAHRIQLLNNAEPAPAPVVPPKRSSPPRWGPAGADRIAPAARVPSPRRRSPPPRRNSPLQRRNSPPRPAKEAPRRKSRSPPRRSPPAIRRPSPPRDRERKRERERTPASASHAHSGSVAPSKKSSASPPRRRARIIPRYECRGLKVVPIGDVTSVVSLRARYTKLYVPSDFVDLTSEWTRRVQPDAAVDMANPIAFHVCHKDIDFPEADFGELPSIEPEDADHKHQVKVLLLAHNGRVDLHKRAFGLNPDGTIDDMHEPTPVAKHLQFLVGMRGKETLPIGGSWSPSLDGADPSDPSTIIRTAIRTTRALTGIDLSSVPQWYELVQVRYYRAEKDRVDRVHLMWPDTQMLMQDDATWSQLQTVLKAQLEAKIAVVEALSVKDEEPKPAAEVSSAPPPTESTAPKEVAGAATPAETSSATEKTDIANSKDDSIVKTEAEASDADSSMVTEDAAGGKSGPTHWSKIDVKTLKVAELRHELESRNLETKGIKTLLAQRLQEALDKEQEAEEDGPPEGGVPTDIVMIDDTADEKDGASGDASAAKSDEELKKLAEELQKKVEKLEKEKKEKKASLERHYTLPKEKKVFVYPSKTFKSGKFDCKIVTLQSLLDYRADDNKESQFETSLFAEAFKEMIERHAAFTVYEAICQAENLDSEKKRRDEARGYVEKDEKTEKVENGGEEKEKEKKEEKKEKIELKSVVSNRSLFEAFAAFDANLCGYLTTRDLEDILFNGEFGITRGQVQRLAARLSSRDKINYRNLTDVLVDAEGVVRFTPDACADAPDSDALVRGYGWGFINATEKKSDCTTMSSCSDGTVVINGNVVNVAQKLEMLEQCKKERDTAKSSLSEQTSLIANLKDTKSELEKKKSSLEKDLERNKKKLSDTGSALKTALEESVKLRSVLADCKKYSERMIIAIDKTNPPSPKKPKDVKEEASVTTVNGTEQKEAGPAEEEEPLPSETDVVLADQVEEEEEPMTEETSEEKPAETDGGAVPTA